MFRRLAFLWLPRLLFVAALAASAFLILLVLVAPLAPADEALSGWRRLAVLFGHDAAVRRTAVACAVGLAVTARIFFRPDAGLPRLRPARKAPPPPNVAAGA